MDSEEGEELRKGGFLSVFMGGGEREFWEGVDRGEGMLFEGLRVSEKDVVRGAGALGKVCSGVWILRSPSCSLVRVEISFSSTSFVGCGELRLVSIISSWRKGLYRGQPLKLSFSNIRRIVNDPYLFPTPTSLPWKSATAFCMKSPNMLSPSSSIFACSKGSIT